MEKEIRSVMGFGFEMLITIPFLSPIVTSVNKEARGRDVEQKALDVVQKALDVEQKDQEEAALRAEAGDRSVNKEAGDRSVNKEAGDRSVNKAQNATKDRDAIIRLVEIDRRDCKAEMKYL
jgi:hypothetical protein